MTELPYRLCALDLDETLLGPDHAISPRNLHAVKQAQAKGVTIVLASGRMNSNMKRFAAQIGLNGPLISYNGAMVRHAVTDETWLHQRISPALAAPLLDFCAPRQLQLNFYLDDKLYTAQDSPWIQLYQKRTGVQAELVPDFYTRFRSDSPTKLIIVDTPEKTDALLAPFRAEYGANLYITKTTAEYLEFMPAGVDKGRALALVAERLNIPQTQTVAFGDSWNDVPMIEWAGLGIAVANARPELLAVADRIVGRSDADGVGIALEELFDLEPM